MSHEQWQLVESLGVGPFLLLAAVLFILLTGLLWASSRLSGRKRYPLLGLAKVVAITLLAASVGSWLILWILGVSHPLWHGLWLLLLLFTLQTGLLQRLGMTPKRALLTVFGQCAVASVVLVISSFVLLITLGSYEIATH